MAAAPADSLEGVTEGPDSLFNLCADFCVANLATFCSFNGNSDLYVALDGVELPSEVSEILIQLCRDKNILNESLLHAFADPSKTKLRRLDVSNCSITDRTLRWFLPHGLVELNISNCSQSLTSESLICINKYGKTLRKLFIGNSWSLFVNTEDIIKHGMDRRLSDTQFFQCPNLKAFSINGIYDLTTTAEDLLSGILQMKTTLTYLDLSSCQVKVETMSYLEEMQQLNQLVLYDVPIRDLGGAVKVLRRLRQLRALDVSQSKDGPVLYRNPENHLRDLVSGLPYLNWLDIAGTNLAGFLSPACHSHKTEKQYSDDSEVAGSPHTCRLKSNARCAIPGLEGRQFQFLGLMDCPHEACERENIPAEKVTGNGSEEQVYLSLRVYMEKPIMLSRALSHLFSMMRYLPIKNVDNAVEAVLLAMKKHPDNLQIQTLGCTCLVLALKTERHRDFSWLVKQRVVVGLLSAMEKNKSAMTLVKRGCYALFYFDLPDDLVFAYRRIVKLMLWFVQHSLDEQLKQNCLSILKCLSSQVEISNKDLMGSLGGVRIMMDNIRRRVQAGWDNDQIMLRSWSILWSLTDMSPANCEKFLAADGIDLFLDCCYAYPEEESLTKKMVGMMCNVAEVPSLRPALMVNDKYLSKLVELTSESLMISNSAAGVLAHLVAEDAALWTVQSPTRDAVRMRLRETVNTWDLETRRNVRYRSFVPMLNLFAAFDVPEAQHWATWEVYNMIIKDPQRYIRMFAAEGGMGLVQALLDDPELYDEIKHLARCLLDKCELYFMERPDEESS